MTHHPHTHGTYVGHDVVDSENHEVGTVSDVIYDDDGNRPTWLVVDLGLLHGARYVPVERSYTAENGNIVVPYDKHQVKGATRPSRDHVLTAADVEQLSAHYELHHTGAGARLGAPDERRRTRDVIQLGAPDKRHPTDAVAQHPGAPAQRPGAGEAGRRVMRYLLLADGPVVADLIRSHVPATQTGDARIHVVVPAREISADEQRMVATENSSPTDGTAPEVVAARWRLRGAIDALAGLGLDEVTGDVGDARPLDALEQALDAGRYDAVVVVTRPIGAAGWVHLDLPHRIERHVDLPVIHVEVDLVDR